MAITQVITTPPAAPTPGEDPAVFNTKILARLSWDTTNVNELNTFASQANALETAVNADADSAAASALTAVNAPGTSATSATSMVIGTGAKSCTIQTGKSIVVGMWIAVANTAAPDVNYMIAVVTSHNSSTGALGFTVPAGSAFGSGTYTAWTISLSPPPSGQYLPLTGGTISGILGIGQTDPVVSFLVKRNITGGATSVAVQASGEIQSDVITNATIFNTGASVVNSAFTLGNLRHYVASQGTNGASATVTDQPGFYAAATLVGAINNYGFYGNIPSGTGRWNCYAPGTARNYFAGGVEPLAGSTAQAVGFINISAAAGPPTGVPTNPTGNVPLYYDTLNNKLYVYNGAWKATAALT